MKDAPIFYQNLEKALDTRRAEHNLITLRKRQNQIDFSSNDFISLGSSGLLRAEFLEELARQPNFSLGSTGSRLLDGNNDYIETIEKEVAAFHGAESALIVNSGFEGNCAIFSTIPQPGDAIVYDELVHASVHEGMARSAALCRTSFRHNDVESFRDTLEAVRSSQPMIDRGQRCVIVSIETIYSMDGDVCPLKEMVEVVKELFPKGNAQLIVDEAHSTGIVGECGVGLVGMLGLQNDVAIRLHTYSKALASSGGVILSNLTVRTMLVNHARPLFFTAAPSYPTLAAIRSGYKLLREKKTAPAQQQLQDRLKLFFQTITGHPTWEEANLAGIIRIPLADDWESRPFQTQIVPVITEARHNYFLSMHLQLLSYSVIPIDPPVVPKGTSRVRLVFKAANTEEDVKGLANAICEWANEMLEIKTGSNAGMLPKAARTMFAAMGGNSNAATTNGVH
jgi:8-amino-7-oxononanoate synthase